MGVPIEVMGVLGGIWGSHCGYGAVMGGHPWLIWGPGGGGPPYLLLNGLLGGWDGIRAPQVVFWGSQVGSVGGGGYPDRGPPPLFLGVRGPGGVAGLGVAWLDAVLPRLRELLVLEDVGAMQMEVGVLARDFPDVR